MTNEQRAELIKSICIHDEKNIKGFFGEYRWLSNFYLCSIEREGLFYPSTEHAYQSAKCINKEDQLKFIQYPPNSLPINVSAAKNLGSKVQMIKNWDELKREVMYEINLYKFSHHPVLRSLLRSTGSKHLEETNYWSDRYWGVCKGVGENWLGEILMKIRNEV